MAEPVKCHDCGQVMAERLFISGLCIGCERARNEELASDPTMAELTRHDFLCAYDDCTGPHEHPGPERTPNATVRQGEPMMVEVSRQTWSWTCDICGWLGVGLFSPDSAWREAERHIEQEHPANSGKQEGPDDV